MALDNPSYFTIPGATAASSARTGRFSLLRKHVRMGTAPSSPSAPHPPPPNHTRERYSLLPTASPPSPSLSPSLSPSPSPSPSPSSNTPPRRTLRSLLRTSPLDSPIHTQMLVLGMPRPSDIAPSHRPTPHPPKHHTRNPSTPNPFPPPPPAPLLPLDDRYYNVLSDSRSGRRHSIGAYFTRNPTAPSRPPPHLHDEPPTPHRPAHPDSSSSTATHHHPGATNNCSCSQHSAGGKSGMEDIVIVSSCRSQAAELWASYLKTCFDQIRKNRKKPPFRILTLAIEDSAASEPFALQENLSAAKLVIFILCPVFLDHLAHHPQTAANVCSHVRPDTALAMLLGIADSAITDDHKTAMPSYPRWRRMESLNDRDEKFVGEFLGAAMDILSNSVATHSPPADKGAFILTPKKVNKSHNKVTVLLNDPITKDDVMRVTLLRNNDAFDIPSVKKRNPYTLIFRVPDDFLAVSTLVTIRLHRNDTDLGTKLLKCESPLYALAHILKACDSPVDFMCQALNLVPCDKDKLDDFMASAFQKNIPPHFNLLQTPPLPHPRRPPSKPSLPAPDDYPTLLHFAARFGLEKLSWLLLECPGGDAACDLRNAADLTPAEMADASGHSRLANALCGYMQMSEFTSVYTFLKGMAEEKGRSRGGEGAPSAPCADSSDDYLNPRPLSETYQVPPSPRPLAPLGYMEMQSGRCREGASGAGGQEGGGGRGCQRREGGEQRQRWNGMQEELIEIMNDFKNKVLTIAEVERLVEEWKNRNDVQQSYREKQEQLSKMREEYERVQQRVREGMREVGRGSPMERLRKFFRGKSKEKGAEGGEGERRGRQEEGPVHRPSSGLSMQSCSSSSSGRLSTGSHCSGASLGDSGTHSDAESERKSRPSAKCCGAPKANDALDNYDVPPNPVCLFTTNPNRPTGLPNYDIPPSALPADGDAPPPDPNYYNLLPKDIPTPNHSTLHARLAGGPGWLKAVEEGAERKTDDGGNCYEYINLPGAKGGAGGERPPADSDEGSADEVTETDVLLPDYVNLEVPKAVPN